MTAWQIKPLLANIEHIIVDGRSKDATLALVNQYPHVSTIVSEKDRGIYHAFNRGVALATGDLVYFLNSDDCFYDNSVIADVLSAISDEHQYYFGSVLCHDAKTGKSYFTLQMTPAKITGDLVIRAFFADVSYLIGLVFLMNVSA